jgi:hypothetical protein
MATSVSLVAWTTFFSFLLSLSLAAFSFEEKLSVGDDVVCTRQFRKKKKKKKRGEKRIIGI